MQEPSGWKKVGPFTGLIHAEMVAEALKQRDIPYFISQNWFSGALSVRGVAPLGDSAFLFVPEEFHQEALDLAEEMFGEEG